MTDIEILKELIKKSEGLKLKSYLCPAGKWTVGFGQTGRGITSTTVWTQAQADNELDRAARKVLKYAVDYSPNLLNESPQKRAAIADFIFNLGAHAYKDSTLRKRINESDWDRAVTEIKRWVHAINPKTGNKEKLGGLVKRRNIEAELLNG